MFLNYIENSAPKIHAKSKATDGSESSSSTECKTHPAGRDRGSSHHKDVKKTKAETSSYSNVNVTRDDRERQTIPCINQEQDGKIKEQ